MVAIWSHRREGEVWTESAGRGRPTTVATKRSAYPRTGRFVARDGGRDRHRRGVVLASRPSSSPCRSTPGHTPPPRSGSAACSSRRRAVSSGASSPPATGAASAGRRAPRPVATELRRQADVDVVEAEPDVIGLLGHRAPPDGVPGPRRCVGGGRPPCPDAVPLVRVGPRRERRRRGEPLGDRGTVCRGHVHAPVTHLRPERWEAAKAGQSPASAVPHSRSATRRVRDPDGNRSAIDR